MKIVNENLSDFEKHILIDKGTEMPFSGEYNDFFESGIYVCKNCENPLFSSESKFKSHCGWPSFESNIDNNVKMQKDKDGRRIEILCGRCDGHLGHVFYGENFTEKNTRHCVNSASIKFIKNSK